MKKVNSRKVILSAVTALTACCLITPEVKAAPELPMSIQNILNETTGPSQKHDLDIMKFDKQRQEVQTDYEKYQEQREENKGGTQGSTVIKGAPEGSSDVIRAKVEELETKGVFVDSIEVAPSEILTREEIEPIISKYAGKNLFISDIQKMIDEINSLYAQKGFVTAKAYLPEQQVENGAIYIDLIESRIGKVTIEGNKWTKSDYILDRIPDKEHELFDIVKLEKDVLDFNRYNEGVRLSANLKAGEKEGTTDIALSADETFPFHIMGVMDNAGRYQTGKLRGGPVLTADSLFGYRDRMTLGSYFSGGAISPFFDYNIPVNKYDGRVGFSYSSTFANVKYGPYAPLGLKTRSYMYSLYYTQPIKRTQGFELKGYGAINYKRAFTSMEVLKDFIGNGALSLDQVTSANVGINLRKDTARGIWYLNQDASMAFPIFDSRSSYFKYSGGLYRIHDFSHGVYGQIRANYQVIPNNKDIPYLDQFQAGGLVTVRGYSEGILIGKSGYFTSAELIFPLLPRQITSPRSGEKIPFIGKYVQGVVFADHAGVFPDARTDRNMYDGSYFLASLGMGIRVQLPGDLSARLYWGYPLVNNAYEQDRKYGRFHFELTLEPNIDKMLKSRSVAAKVVPQVQKEVEAEFINNYDDIRHYDYFLDEGAL